MKEKKTNKINWSQNSSGPSSFAKILIYHDEYIVLGDDVSVRRVRFVRFTSFLFSFFARESARIYTDGAYVFV